MPKSSPFRRRDSGTAADAADGEADERHRGAFAEDHPQDRAALGAERHADAELVRPLADREREHAGDADRGDGERQPREQADERRVEPLRRDRLVPDFLQRLHVIDRPIRIELRESSR